MKASVKINFVSFIVALVSGLAASFLYAVVLRDCWNWFLVPVAPVVLIGYGQAYGVCIAIDVVSTLVARVTDDDTENQEAFPFLYPLLKTLARTVVILFLWGFAAIAHCAIG